MLKYVVTAVFGLALCCPVAVDAHDGCCDPDPCVKTRKRLALVDVTKERCRLKRVCVTDECGCTTRKWVRVKECVTRKRLALVDCPVDPCRGMFQRLGDRFNRCGDCCPSPCDGGCGCGCGG